LLILILMLLYCTVRSQARSREGRNLTESNEQTRIFFDRLAEFVKTLVREGGEFEMLGIGIERDFRGFKYDVFSVRVLNDGSEGKGVMKEALFKF